MKIEPISSQQNPRYKRALRLQSSRSRRQENQTLVIGLREVERAILAGATILEVMVNGEQVEQPNVRHVLSQLKEGDPTKVFSLTSQMLDKLAYGDRESSVVAIVQRPETSLRHLAIAEDSLIIVLESLEKPGNLGAIVRSADASGCSAIILADPKTDIFHPNAIRSSVATVFSIPIAIGSQAEVEQWLLSHHFQIYFAFAEASIHLFQIDLTGKSAVVFGNEAEGIGHGWHKELGKNVSIPMRGIGDSLNVSVTASLFMYERLRQLQK